MKFKVIDTNINLKGKNRNVELLACGNWGIYFYNDSVFYLVYIPTGRIGYRFRSLKQAYGRILAFYNSETLMKNKSFVCRIINAIKRS